MTTVNLDIYFVRMSYNAASEGGAGSEKGGELLEGYAEYLRGTAPDTHKQSSPRPRNIIMRACPECGVEMRSDSITKHCKLKHKVSYRYCSACAKYVQKKVFKSHLKKHESGELAGEVTREEEENDLDTSKDEDDEADELIIEDDVVTSEPYDTDTDAESKKKSLGSVNKIYNCFDCNRMFMSQEAHSNHLREVHGGEGGSVVLKLPTERRAEAGEGEEAEEEDKVDDAELVIDDEASQQ